MQTNQQILHELKNILNLNIPGKINKIILFGSQIKKKNPEYSDYDILIILKEDYTGKKVACPRIGIHPTLRQDGRSAPAAWG